MNSAQPDAFMLSINLNREGERPLYKQIYDFLREAILTQQLAAGVRLPSTRDLADLLDVSRNTVMNAFDQLLAEGYLEARVGSGTYVTRKLPEEYLRAYNQTPPTPAQETTRTLSRRGQAYASHFRPGALPRHPVFPHSQPDLDAFPFDLWTRLLTKRQQKLPRARFGYDRFPTGYQPLREAIAGYLRAARAVQCDPEQILIVSGSQEGLYLSGEILLDRGDGAWVEDPGYQGARAALLCASVRLAPAPVDDEGMDVDAARSRDDSVRVAYVTPSHQFPLGHTMSLARRMRLLEWAAGNDAWILEDDYDSEYRYSGPPLASLQGLDVNQRVIYVGTFSKVLFPGLRLGYLVAPPDLIGAFTVAATSIRLAPPTLAQATLADFIAEGHFARHVRRMRTRYGERRDVLVAALQQELEGALELGPSDAGMHLTAWLPPGMDDVAVQQEALQRSVTAFPISRLYLERPSRGGLVLGFATARPGQIRAGVRRLAQAIDAVMRNGRQDED